jgi:hypothetical protein
MKTSNQLLIYDDYCPLCSWYSGMFVKYGLLKAENRVPFSIAEIEILTAIDIEKAKDEIPLFDKDERTTLYGIDSLLEILSWRMPILKSIGNIPPIKWFLKKFYKFISYNRKVIVAKKCSTGVFDCSPYFSFQYRISFMIVFLVFNSLMLIPLHQNLFTCLSFYHLNLAQLQFAHICLVALNFTIASFLNPKKAIEYLGQVNMLALISILLLLPLMFITSFILSEWFAVGYLGTLTVFIIKEYFRRMKYANVFTVHKPIILVNLVCLTGFLLYVFH